MSWKNEISEYYQDKLQSEYAATREEIDSFFDLVVLPAFNDIKVHLSKYIKVIKIQRYVYKAKLRFEEIHIRKSVFHVEISKKGNYLSFPYELNDVYCSGDHVEIESLDLINKDFIIAKFMEYFRFREQKIQEYNSKKYDIDEDFP